MKNTTKEARVQTVYSAVNTATLEPRFKDKVNAMPNMTYDIVTGKWGKERSARRTLFFALLAFCYVLSPLDLIPEAILLIPGLLDDAVLAAWATSSLFRMAGDYVEETEQPTIIYAQATRI